jgi:MarR family transcriptional regulator, transcriptional regulator for hemolysin
MTARNRGGEETSRNLENTAHAGDSGRTDGVRRPRDLAALMAPLARDLVRAEEPVLQANGLTMWAYAVLLALTAQPARSQAALAAQIGADKTRLIPILDDLQKRGLIERSPDPADRRSHLLAATPEGRRTTGKTQQEIQHQEDELLALLLPDDRAALFRALHVLTAHFREQPS